MERLRGCDPPVTAAMLGSATLAAVAAGVGLRPMSARRLPMTFSGAPPPWEVLALVGCSAVLALVWGPVVAAVAIGVVGILEVARRARARQVAVSRATARLPDVCEHLGRLLGGGAEPLAALTEAAAQAPADLAVTMRRAASTGLLGGSVAEELRNASGHGAALAPLAACWGAAATAGVPLAPAIAGIGVALGAVRDHDRRLTEELAAPRLTGWLLAALPLFGFGIAAAMGSSPLTILLSTPLGAWCLVLGAVLDALGVWWIRTLGRRAAAA